MDTNNYEGVRCNITMHRTLYLPKNEDMSDEEFLNIAKKEIILPHNALAQVASLLRRTNINISGLDLKDWGVDNVEYKLIKE